MLYRIRLMKQLLAEANIIVETDIDLKETLKDTDARDEIILGLQELATWDESEDDTDIIVKIIEKEACPGLFLFKDPKQELWIVTESQEKYLDYFEVKYPSPEVQPAPVLPGQLPLFKEK